MIAWFDTCKHCAWTKMNYWCGNPLYSLFSFSTDYESTRTKVNPFVPGKQKQILVFFWPVLCVVIWRKWHDAKVDDFWNFDFSRFFRGSKSKFSSKSAIWTKIWTLTPWKIAKIKISKIVASLFCIIPKATSRPNFSIIGLVDSRNNSILCQNWPFFLQSAFFPIFDNTPFS